ncbi:MAG: hypothetical protein M1821_004515 [Bathelium mastoideum]|nr:MAG: hypothetical protein M1821_004515 [Bathelium mastoideum]
MLNLLCLHAAFGNPKTFREELDPLFGELEAQGKVKLHYARGPCEMPLDLVNSIKALDTSLWLFPDPPHYCWTSISILDVSGVGIAVPGAQATAAAVDEAVKHIEEHILPNMESFDGFVACSESGIVATRLAQRHKSIKCGIIFCGVASIHKSITKSDFAPKTDAERIPIYSLHIFGMKDIVKESAVTIHSYYNQDKARMLQHAKGHTIPSDPKNRQRMRKCIADFLALVQPDANGT